jgi:hypothetical protein
MLNHYDLSLYVGWFEIPHDFVRLLELYRFTYELSLYVELPSWRPISNPKPCLIWVQPESGFQPLKRVTLWVHAHIDTP